MPLGETWSGPVTGAVTRTFSNNFVATESVNSVSPIAFGYDADGLLTQAGPLAIARSAATGLVTSDARHDHRYIHATTRSASRRARRPGANSTQVFDVQITRDALGQITHRVEVVDGITRLFEYAYDLAGRLGTVRCNGRLVVLCTYDGNGNRLSAEGAAGLVEGTYDDRDRVLTYGPASC